LNRGRYADDEGDGDTVGGEIQQLRQLQPIPPDERSERHHLSDQQGDKTKAECGPSSPALHVVYQGSAGALRSASIIQVSRFGVVSDMGKQRALRISKCARLTEQK